MYLVGFLIFMVFLYLSTALTSSFTVFIDAPSLMIILFFSVSMLMASGLLPDFLRGFSIMGKKENTYTLIELNKTKQALKLMIKLLLLSGLLGCIIGAISLLAGLGDPSLIGPNLAVSMLSLFYSLLFVFILLPIKARVDAILLTID